MDAQEFSPPDEVLVSVLTLFTEICSSPTGARTLLDYGIVKALSESEFIYRSLQAQDLTAGAIETDAHLNSELPPCLIPVLSLVKGLLVSLPEHSTACTQVCEWFVRRYKSGGLAALLKLRGQARTLSGLKALSLTVGILDRLAQFPQVFDQQVGRLTANLDTLFWKLLALFGPHQLPPNQNDAVRTMLNKSEHNWWVMVNPIDETEKMHQGERLSTSEYGTHSPEWTFFDLQKVEACQSILSSVISYLRTRMEWVSVEAKQAERSVLGVQHIVDMAADIEVPIATLKKCTEFASKIALVVPEPNFAERVQPKESGNNYQDDRDSTLPYKTTIRHIHGLLIIIYMSLLLSTSDSESNRHNILQCIKNVEKTIIEDKFIRKFSKLILKATGTYYT